MKKILALILSTSLVSKCSVVDPETKDKKDSDTKKTNIVNKASDKMMAFGEKSLVAYATSYPQFDKENLSSNLVANELYKSAIKYNYDLLGWPDDKRGKEGSDALASGIETSNYYDVKSLNSPQQVSAGKVGTAILRKWSKASVKLGFIQSDSSSDEIGINSQLLYDAIKDKVYSGKLVLSGTNSSYVNRSDGKTTQKWNSQSNVATFEFSEIISAYYTGYLTQAQFGKLKKDDGTHEKKSVGYIVAVLKRHDDNWNTLQIKKANAFRLGVLAANKEQETGKASFALPKNLESDNLEKTLIFAEDDIGDYFGLYKEMDAYVNNDHSFTYYVGADPEVNLKVATELSSYGVSNKLGHKLIVETAAFAPGDKVSGFGDQANAAWKIDNGEEKSVTTRVFMASKSWIKPKKAGDDDSKEQKLSQDWQDAQLSASAHVVEAVLAAELGENIGKINYFGKHNYIGSFPTFSKVNTNGVNDKAQPIDAQLLNEVRKKLYLKNINLENISDNFLEFKI